MFVAIRDRGRCRVGEAESLELAHYAVARILCTTVSAARALWLPREEVEAVANEHGFELEESLLGVWQGRFFSFEAFGSKPMCAARSSGVWYRNFDGDFVAVDVEQAVL